MEKFLNRIIEQRKAKGFTQKQMAEKLNVSQVNYGKWESGKTPLTLDRLVRISNILNTDMVTLLWPDYNVANATQELRKENAKLKKNTDLLIEQVEDKKRIIGFILSLYPEAEKHLESMFHLYLEKENNYRKSIGLK